MFLGLEGGLGRGDLAGAAHLELVSGVVPLRPEDAMTEAMLSGWRAQQKARGLAEARSSRGSGWCARSSGSPTSTRGTGGRGTWRSGRCRWPRERHLAASTIRGYQTDLRLFSEYLCDGRYGWAAECEKAFGAGVHPVPVCHEWNTIAHLNEYEGSPEARPFTRGELQRFLDFADGQVERAVKARRKGALAAYRDATLFKVIYGWGLRRTEASKLDVADWGRNPAAPEFGRYGMLHVRYGKAVRGQPPRRRNVPSVMGWAVEAVADYAENIRPKFGCGDHPALWVTERGGRVKPAEINARFVAYRDALGLPSGPDAAQPAAFVGDAPDRGRGGPAVHPGGRRAPLRHLDRDLHPCQRRFHEHRAAQGAGPGARRAAGLRTGEDDGAQAGLPVEPAAGDGQPRHVPTTDLAGPLAERGIRLSSSQVYRLVTERPERLSLKVLMALLDILGCSMDDLVEPVAAVTPGRKARAAGGGDAGVGGLRPKRARITRAGE